MVPGKSGYIAISPSFGTNEAGTPQVRGSAIPAHTCGFTLIELMITLAVAAVLLMIGVPSFRHILVSTHLSGISNDLAGDLQYARTQAVSRQVNVEVAASSGSWQNGWTVQIPPATTAATATPEVLRVHPAVSDHGQYPISVGTTMVTYQAQGMLTNSTGTCFTIYATHGEHNPPHFLQILPAGMLQQTSDTDTPPTNPDCPAPP